MSNDTSQEVFCVLVNKEEQYSIWQQGMEIPKGWESIDFKGSKEECMAHVDEIWTDMRPLSARV